MIFDLRCFDRLSALPRRFQSRRHTASRETIGADHNVPSSEPNGEGEMTGGGRLREGCLGCEPARRHATEYRSRLAKCSRRADHVRWRRPDRMSSGRRTPSRSIFDRRRSHQNFVPGRWHRPLCRVLKNSSTDFASPDRPEPRKRLAWLDRSRPTVRCYRLHKMIRLVPRRQSGQPIPSRLLRGNCDY